MAYVLRPDQVALKRDLRQAFLDGHQAIIACAMTGFGKTVFAADIIKETVKRGKKVLFLARQEELIGQCCEKLEANGVFFGVIRAGDYKHINRAPVQVASAATLVNRLYPKDPDYQMWIPEADLIFLDECHENSIIPTTRKILAKYPNARIVGLSATPERTDGKGLGRSVGGVFDAIVYGPSPKELIGMGLISDYVIFKAPDTYDFEGVKIVNGEFDAAQALKRVDTPDLIGKVYENWKARADGKSTIIFAQHTIHGHHLHEKFVEEGENFEYVDADTSKEERRRIVEDFKSKKLLGVINVGLYVRGFDVPHCECIVQAFKTNSLIKHLQTLGRGLRPYENKDRCIILDHGNNAEDKEKGGQGLGLPDDDREWSLEGRKKRTSNPVTSITCPVCRAIVRSTTRVCYGELLDGGVCGHVFIYVAPKDPVPTTASAMLVEMDRTGRLTPQQKAQIRIDEEKKYLSETIKKQELYKGISKYDPRSAIFAFRYKYKFWPTSKHGVEKEFKPVFDPVKKSWSKRLMWWSFEGVRFECATIVGDKKVVA